MDPTPKTPYICPICINPKTPIFQDFNPIDFNAARVLLCAAKIVSGLMSKAVVQARVKVERKAKAAIISRKKARIATQVFDCVVAKAKIKEKLLLVYDDSKCAQCGSGGNGDELLLCHKCDRGFHLFCLRPLLGSVSRGSWFCAQCSAQLPNKPDTEKKALDNTELVGGQEKSDCNKTTHLTGFGSTTSNLLDKAKVFSRDQTDSSVNTKGIWGGATLEDIGEWSSKFVQNTPKPTFDRETSCGSAFDGDGRSFPNALIKVLVPNQTDLPDMAVDEELLTKAMLRNSTPPLSERARAGQSDKAVPFKKKEKIQSTTKRVSKSKLVGEPEGEVKFGATVLKEEEMTVNEEDLDGVNIGGDRTEIPLNGGGEENEVGDVDPDALKKKKGKRPVSPSKEKVGGGHRHKKHKKSSSKGNKRSNKEANIGESLVAGSVKCANDCRARCKKAEAELKGCEAQFDMMENQIKSAKRKVKDAKQQVHAAKKYAQNFAKDMKDSEDAVKKKDAELRTRNKEQEQELTALKKEVERLTAVLAKQKDKADSINAKLDPVPSNAQVIKKYKESPNYCYAVAIQGAHGMNKFAA